MQSQPHDQPVYLGFSNEFDDDELYRLKSHFLPLGKIGGMPSWLNPRNLPPTSQLLCQVCAKPMCFMLQVYATSEEDPVHSFHRTLFLFICRNPECSRANDASNLAAFRCQLPRQNPFYNSEGPMDPDFGDAENPLKDDTWMKICKVCGAGATKKCGRCGKVWYCDREHQAFDWSKSHKVRCQQENVGEEEKKNPTNEFLFTEYGMEMERENVPATLLADISDSENDDDDDEEIEQERRMRDFQKFVANHKNDEEIAGSELEDAEESQEKDVSFARFNRLVSRNPEQVLRYQRGGIPLPATDRAPAPPQPPNCDLCGGKRYFELQLTPHLLSLLGVDTLGHSIDFASIYVFTCASSCPIVDSGYAREFIFKQDFA